MLRNHKAVTTIAVNDLENAVDFYTEVLGLDKIGKNTAGYLVGGDGITIGLYQSTTAGTGQATCAWWTVDDVEETVALLKSAGITFDKNYDIPKSAKKGDIYLLSDDKMAAWFKDPDGNILGIGNF